MAAAEAAANGGKKGAVTCTATANGDEKEKAKTKARKKGRRSRDKGKVRTKEKMSKEGIRKIGENRVLDFLSCTFSARGKSAVKCRLEQN